MTKIFSKNIFIRVICLFLTTVFLSSFPAGATSLALCLDEDENHIVDQNSYLANCHSYVDSNLLLSDEHCSALAEKENNDCFDVSLTNANTLNLPSKIILPGFTKTILSYTLPSRLIGFQQQVEGNNSSALSQHLFILPHTNSHRTVVLLI
jgi:hypothetical protein